MTSIIPNQTDETVPHMCSNCVLQFLCYPHTSLDTQQLADLDKIIQ